jgi:tetraprenyl-beta-curcumene synthase
VSGARGGSLRLFASAGRQYWLGVFPSARSAQRRLQARAAAIPDPTLRCDALVSHRHKRANSEGLAAMALFAPAERREEIVPSLVAYQLMLDYLDGVSERPAADPMANGLRLHSAFEVALDPEAEHHDYYGLARAGEDDGYLVELIETVRRPLGGLPSYPVVREALLRQARLGRDSQALNHALRFAPIQEQVDRWAGAPGVDAGVGSEFEWWEMVAAAAASSLCVGALLALAAKPGVGAAEASAVEAAYFPWASGLNALLDSLVDLDEDPVGASHLRRYRSREDAARRLTEIAAGARRRVSLLPEGRLHEAVLAAMGALYLSQPEAWKPEAEAVSRSVYEAFGPLTGAALVVHVARRGGRGGGALLRAFRRRNDHPDPARRKQDLPDAVGLGKAR